VGTGVPGSLVGVVSALVKGTHHGRCQWRVEAHHTHTICTFASVLGTSP